MAKHEFEIILAATEELKEKAFAIREEVFVVEQEVDKRDEFDEYESESRHFVVLDSQQVGIGASRWRKTEKGVKLERFAIKGDRRNEGIGQQLVQATLDDINAQLGSGHRLYLHAQLSAVSLYERFGFRKVGDQFSECDILHYKMERLS